MIRAMIVISAGTCTSASIQSQTSESVALILILYGFIHVSLPLEELVFLLMHFLGRRSLMRGSLVRFLMPRSRTNLGCSLVAYMMTYWNFVLFLITIFQGLYFL